MKRVVSVSLGSSKRNSRVETEILGTPFVIERIGTDGDMINAISLVKELDGKVDAIGLGGIDLYISAGQRRYTIRDAERIARAARITPVVDGSGLKNTLERKVINDLDALGIISWQGKKVFLVSGADRFGMAETLVAKGAQVVFGDLMMGLGLPIPLYSLAKLERVAYFVAPIVCRLPFRYLYPTGKKQGQNRPRFEKYYQEAEVIAGDFHFIWKHLPGSLAGRTIITNTVTQGDVQELAKRGISRLITTTPELNGRSFGTNVMEGVVVTLLGKGPEEVTASDYEGILDAIGFKPRVVEFSTKDQYR